MTKGLLKLWTLATLSAFALFSPPPPGVRASRGIASSTPATPANGSYLQRSPDSVLQPIQGLASTRFIDASIEGIGASSGRVYLFRGGKYRRYNWANDQFDDGGSLPTFAWHLPVDFLSGLDTTLSGRGAFSIYAYFFKNGRYLRYNWSSGRVDYGPGALNSEWGMPEPFSSGVDAAINGEGAFQGKAYFFKAGQYLRYDWSTGKVDPGFPQSIVAWHFPPPFDQGIDSAIAGKGNFAGKAFFIRGSQYIRYDWGSQSVDPGYPKTLATSWPSLAAMNEKPQRRIVLYASIDNWDPHATDGSVSGHVPNFTRLRTIANAYDPKIIVDDWWGKNIHEKILKDPHLLAVFGAGSFTEWYKFFGDASWSSWLAPYRNLIWQSKVPVLAICGSHQFLSTDDWNDIGHMAASSTSETTIAMESNGVSKIPAPRPGEHGVYPIQNEGNDPIFSGIPNPMYFVESHSDEVIEGHYLSSISEIGTSVPSMPSFKTTVTQDTDDVRARVQTLKSLEPGRVYYSAQFHPELPPYSISDYTTPEGASRAAEAMNNGEKLIRNFLAIAAQHWAAH